MQILTLDNTTYPLNSVPDEVDDNMRFSVLDNSDSDKQLINLKAVIFEFLSNLDKSWEVNHANGTTASYHKLFESHSFSFKDIV